MQEERFIFKTLADAVTSTLEKQGLERSTASMMSANLVQAQLDAVETMGYKVKIEKVEDGTRDTSSSA